MAVEVNNHFFLHKVVEVELDAETILHISALTVTTIPKSLQVQIEKLSRRLSVSDVFS